MLRSFKAFILRGSVVDLAVGIVIGAAFGALITQFVASFITPLIAAIGGQRDFGELRFTVNGAEFAWGLFLNALIAFLLIAASIFFFVVVPVNRLMEARKTEPPLISPTRDCPECMSSIPQTARRCAFCTSEVSPPPAG